MRSLLTCCLLVPRAGMRRVATCRILCDFLLVCIFFNSFSFPFFCHFLCFRFVYSCQLLVLHFLWLLLFNYLQLATGRVSRVVGVVVVFRVVQQPQQQQ